MPAPRRLWTGPPGAAIRDRLLDDLGAEPAALWIVPTPLAQNQVEWTLNQRSTGGQRPAGLLAGMICGGPFAVRPRTGRSGSRRSRPARSSRSDPAGARGWSLYRDRERR